MPLAAITNFLAGCLESGGFILGQVRVSPGPVLTHVEETAILEILTHPEDAREIAKYDDEGNFRPLKTAPNLRHGWELRLASADELRRALEFLYPAAIGTWLAFQRGALEPTNLRETLARQTGMYRVTQLLTDAQAEEVIRTRCNRATGCLRRQIWRISPEVPSPFTCTPSELRGLPEIPILCAEACNLFVSDCRPVAKRNLPNRP